MVAIHAPKWQVLWLEIDGVFIVRLSKDTLDSCECLHARSIYTRQDAIKANTSTHVVIQYNCIYFTPVEGPRHQVTKNCWRVCAFSEQAMHYWGAFQLVMVAVPSSGAGDVSWS